MQITPIRNEELFRKLAERREWSFGCDLADQSSIRFVEDEKELANFVSKLRPEQQTDKVLSEKKVPIHLEKMLTIKKALQRTPDVTIRGGLVMANEPATARNGQQGGWHVFTFLCLKYAVDEAVVVEIMMQPVSYFMH